MLKDYLFIDGGCLDKAIEPLSLRYFGSPDALTVDFRALRHSFAKAFYYHGLDDRAHGETREAWMSRTTDQRDRFDAIRSSGPIHVRLGDRRGANRRQKKVDTLLSVDMLLNTVRGNMDRCTLIAGDSDFEPLIDALVREGMHVRLWHPPLASSDLIHAADESMVLNFGTLGAFVSGPNGRSIVVPIDDGTPSWLEGSTPVVKWTERDSQYAIYNRGSQWSVARFQSMNGFVSTMIYTDKDLSLLIRSIEDQLSVTAPAESWTLVQ